MNTNEKHDLELLQKGSSDAFESLFYAYGGKLHNFLLKFSSGNSYLAEEITQRTFIKVWETHSLINTNKSFISYLCTIAKNMLLNEYQRQTVEFVYKEYIVNHTPLKDNVTPEKELYKKLLEEYINKLIDKLPPARRQIFILSKKDMLTNKEIAKELNISESTIQTQLSKALSFMKEELAKHYDEIVLILLLFNVVN